MTGLSMDTSEQFQVQNYGVGGHFKPHWDIIIRGAPCNGVCDNGNRMATVLFYASFFCNINR